MFYDYEFFHILFSSLCEKAKYIINFYHSNRSQTNYQIDLLRTRYYSQLTYLEQIAKYYGELSYISKLILQITTIFGLVLPILFLNNNILSFLVIFSLPFFWFLESQYIAMEKRFQELVGDLEKSQMQLNQALNTNLKLTEQLEIALKKNTETLNQLELSHIKIEQLQEKIQNKEIEIQQKFELIDSSTKEINQITKNFIAFKADNIKDSKLLLEQLNQACLVMEKTQVSLNKMDIIDEELQKSILFTKNIEEFIQRNFSGFLQSNEPAAQFSKTYPSPFNV